MIGYGIVAVTWGGADSRNAGGSVMVCATGFLNARWIERDAFCALPEVCSTDTPLPTRSAGTTRYLFTAVVDTSMRWLPPVSSRYDVIMNGVPPVGSSVRSLSAGKNCCPKSRLNVALAAYCTCWSSMPTGRLLVRRMPISVPAPGAACRLQLAGGPCDELTPSLMKIWSVIAAPATVPLIGTRGSVAATQKLRPEGA